MRKMLAIVFAAAIATCFAYAEDPATEKEPKDSTEPVKKEPVKKEPVQLDEKELSGTIKSEERTKKDGTTKYNVILLETEDGKKITLPKGKKSGGTEALVDKKVTIKVKCTLKGDYVTVKEVISAEEVK
jgi:hypothetical protein